MENKQEPLSHKAVIEELFRKYYKALYNYTLRIVGDKAVAEDIVQNVFYDLWNRKDELSFTPSIKSYLFRSAYTKALNHLTGRLRTTIHYQEQMVDGNISRVYLESMESEPDSELFVRELDQIIRRTVYGLPPQCRKVFILSRTHNMKNREIALLLDISLKAVEKHISKALLQIRSALNEVMVEV